MRKKIIKIQQNNKTRRNNWADGDNLGVHNHKKQCLWKGFLCWPPSPSATPPSPGAQLSAAQCPPEPAGPHCSGVLRTAAPPVSKQSSCMQGCSSGDFHHVYLSSLVSRTSPMAASLMGWRSCVQYNHMRAGLRPGHPPQKRCQWVPLVALPTGEVTLRGCPDKAESQPGSS